MRNGFQLKRLFALFSFIILISSNSNAQGNEQCTVAVNGQRVATGPIGSRFTLRNIPAGNQFVRACVICTDENGETLYALSDRFQITNNETFLLLDDLDYSPTPPPTIRSLSIFPFSTTILSLNESLQLQVTARLSDDTDDDVTQRIQGTTYTSSNSQIATVSRDGLITGISVGTASITVINEGVTAVKQVIVAESVFFTTVEGFVFDENGDPIAGAQVTTSFGGAAITDANGFYSITLQVPSDFFFNVQVLIPDPVNPLVAFLTDLNIVEGGITDGGILKPQPYDSIWTNPAGGKVDPISRLIFSYLKLHNRNAHLLVFCKLMTDVVFHGYRS